MGSKARGGGRAQVWAQEVWHRMHMRVNLQSVRFSGGSREIMEAPSIAAWVPMGGLALGWHGGWHGADIGYQTQPFLSRARTQWR